MKMRRAVRRRFVSSMLSTGFQDSTMAELAWGRSRSVVPRWGFAGAVFGSLVSLIAFAPAAWLAHAITSGSHGRFVLADARGTVWSGSAVAVLTGGPGSVDASALPGRLSWSMGWRWTNGLQAVLSVQDACCLNGTQRLALQPGWGRWTATFLPATQVSESQPTWLGQWPSSWLSGLGTPWNTLQLGGVTRLTASGSSLQWASGRWNFSGQVLVDLLGVSSRVSPLPLLGSYRLMLTGDPANPGQASMALSTSEGALQLTGSGNWSANGVRFRGEARAQPGDETALSNLLNIIGRRDGSRSVISIG
jgi:general secretion pathway protein N